MKFLLTLSTLFLFANAHSQVHVGNGGGLSEINFAEALLNFKSSNNILLQRASDKDLIAVITKINTFIVPTNYFVFGKFNSSISFKSTCKLQDRVTINLNAINNYEDQARAITSGEAYYLILESLFCKFSNFKIPKKEVILSYLNINFIEFKFGSFGRKNLGIEFYITDREKLFLTTEDDKVEISLLFRNEAAKHCHELKSFKVNTLLSYSIGDYYPSISENDTEYSGTVEINCTSQKITKNFTVEVTYNVNNIGTMDWFRDLDNKVTIKSKRVTIH